MIIKYFVPVTLVGTPLSNLFASLNSPLATPHFQSHFIHLLSIKPQSNLCLVLCILICLRYGSLRLLFFYLLFHFLYQLFLLFSNLLLIRPNLIINLSKIESTINYTLFAWIKVRYEGFNVLLDEAEAVIIVICRNKVVYYHSSLFRD